MEFEEKLLQLVSKAEAVDAKMYHAMSLFMLATADCLASGELTPGDPEWKAMAARVEALGLRQIARAAASVETLKRKAAEFASTPHGEAVAEADRRIAVSAVALAVRADEFAAFMRSVDELDWNSAGRPSSRRCRRPNARYFGPEWTN